LHQAIVETDQPKQQWALNITIRAGRPNAATEHCRITHDSPQRVVIEAELQEPGLLILADTYYPGWTATVTTDGRSNQTAIYRTNRVLRGVWLAVGKQTIEFRYQPRSFYAGAIISAISWLALAGFGLSRFVRRQK
jgi:uncharacterized membrane protein YfhO